MNKRKYGEKNQTVG